jgi:hypothetical protein
MAKPNNGPDKVTQYRSKGGKKDSVEENNVKSMDGGGLVFNYKPTAADSPMRRTVWDRYTEMKDDPLRAEAEKQWDLGMKMYRMWAPPRDSRDWRADIILPDGFSAVQAHMQETINLRPRPLIKGVNAQDAPLEHFASAVFNSAMDNTEFDQETYKARNASAICGTAFTLEEYRYETRKVMDPVSYDEGEIKYKEKTIVDFDDVYTRYIDNWSAFFDPGAEDQKYGQDCAHREVMTYDTFKEVYEGKPEFKNVDKVVAAGDVAKNAGYFKMANDIDKNDVELIHYWNRLTDTYAVLCNNIIIRNTPLPSKHKELPMDVWSFYPIPGQIYGMGIPFIIHSLVEERRSIRNLSLDRQKMHISKMFIVNDLFDVSEDDLTPRPHGIIRLNTNGLPLRDAVQALEYGDVPGSSLRMDEALKEDERRAHGMDDRPALQQGGTATEAAIVKETAQQRINLINTLSNWNTLVRLGRKKWSNVQFFYTAKRMELVHEDNELKDKKVYRNIKVQGYEFEIKGDEKKGDELQLATYAVPGYSSFRMDPTYARFMQRNYDIIMDAESTPVISRAIKRAQINEMFGQIAGNPLFSRFLDIESSLSRVIEANDESPATWMLNDGLTEDQQRMMAEQENQIFMEMEISGNIFRLPGTPKATERHNEVHLDFMNTEAYKALSAPIKAAFQFHVQDEIEKNPALAAAAQAAAGAVDPNAGGGNAVAPGMPGGPLPPESAPLGEPATANGGAVTQAMVAA